MCSVVVMGRRGGAVCSGDGEGQCVVVMGRRGGAVCSGDGEGGDGDQYMQ